MNDVIVYPTDTVYGIGCNALRKDLVEKIYVVKGRSEDKPVSVIAPSKKWILENFLVSKDLVDKYLPGPFTLIVRKKDVGFLDYIAPIFIGVRIPDHDFSKMVSKIGVPFVTTSANFSGERAASKVSDLKKSFVESVVLVVDGGSTLGVGSTLIDLRDGLKVVERD